MGRLNSFSFFVFIFLFLGSSFVYSEMINYGKLPTDIDLEDYICNRFMEGEFQLCYTFEDDNVDVYVNANATGITKKK